MNNEIDQLLGGLLSPTEAAKSKEMTLNTFKYKVARGGPLPVVVGKGHAFYRQEEIEAWKPSIKGRKTKK